MSDPNTSPKTVLVTGASGFIAKHVVLNLLNAGYNVVGSLRSPKRADEVIAAVTPGLNDATRLGERLRFVTLDLTRDQGWDDAMTGIDVLMHTASPFPMTQPRDENDVIRPAVDGVLRALNAAHKAGIKRVIVTSSTAAITYGGGDKSGAPFDHTDWSDPENPKIPAYAKSKTLAELAAWDFVKTTAPDMQLTAVNPGMVLGAPLDDHFGTSVQVLERLLRALDPMMPRMGFPLVDIKDVADMHVNAIVSAQTIGQRLVCVTGFLSFVELAQTIKAAYPNRKVVTRQAPDFVVRLLAIFDKSVRGILDELGKRREVSAAHTSELMDMKFIPAKDAVIAAADYLVKSGKV